MYIKRNSKKNYKFNFKKIGIVLAFLSILVFITNKFFPIEGKVKPNQIVSADELTTPKDTDIIPGSNVTYGGEKYSVPAEEVVNLLKNKENSTNTQTNATEQSTDTKPVEKKQVFLTFDDGPSPNTEKVLNILKEKGVHATFFVMGHNLKNYSNAESILKRCIEEGNAIANHTYTHDFKKLYPGNNTNVNTVLTEFNETNNLLKSYLGNDFDTRVLRLPGGYMSRKYYKDSNISALDEAFKSNGIVSIDWNALSSDADGKNYSVNELLQNAISTSKDKNNIVILMHDTYGKEKTTQMLSDLIDYYKSNGYEFKTIKS